MPSNCTKRNLIMSQRKNWIRNKWENKTRKNIGEPNHYKEWESKLKRKYTFSTLISTYVHRTKIKFFMSHAFLLGCRNVLKSEICSENGVHFYLRKSNIERVDERRKKIQQNIRKYIRFNASTFSCQKVWRFRFFSLFFFVFIVTMATHDKVPRKA